MTRIEWLANKYKLDIDGPWSTGQCRHGLGVVMKKTNLIIGDEVFPNGASDPYTAACSVVRFCRDQHRGAIFQNASSNYD